MSSFRAFANHLVGWGQQASADIAGQVALIKVAP